MEEPMTSNLSICVLCIVILGTARYAYVLAPPADDLIHALKYKGWPELAPFMASAMTPLLVPDSAGPALVPNRIQRNR